MKDPVNSILNTKYVHIDSDEQTQDHSRRRSDSYDDINVHRRSTNMEHMEDTSNKTDHVITHTKTDAVSKTNHPITLAVRHYVKWECALEFEKWTDEMDAEMSRYCIYT
jgi:superfamily I DNA and/or RNA helicase